MVIPPNPVSVAGKLFLLGEYAVLAGGAALLTTVDRHLHIEVRDDRDGYRLAGATIDDPWELPLIVEQLLREDAGLDVDPNQLTAHVGEFHHQGAKLGLGSSAASTVALIAAMAPHLGVQRRFHLAWKAHHRLQGGRGSGADIAASTFGGPLAYQLASPAPPFDGLHLPAMASTSHTIKLELANLDGPLRFPDDLRIDAVWTGSPARSTSFVDGLAHTLADQPGATKRLLHAISTQAQLGIAALRHSDTTAFIDATRQGDRLMEELGALTDLPIITDTHRQIRAMATTTDRVAKPSGAGGGDFTLLVGQGQSPIPAAISEQFLTLRIH